MERDARERDFGLGLGLGTGAGVEGEKFDQMLRGNIRRGEI